MAMHHGGVQASGVEHEQISACRTIEHKKEVLLQQWRTPGFRIRKAASKRGMTYVPTVCEAASRTRPVCAWRRSETARTASAATSRMLLHSGSSAWPASVSHVAAPRATPFAGRPYGRTVSAPPNACSSIASHGLP